MMQKLQRPGMMGPCTETALMLAHAQALTTSMHQLHLKITGPGSYSAHKALNELYDALPDHADSLAEGYQGAAECILSYVESCPRLLSTVEDGIAYIRELCAIICQLQSIVPYSEIVNDLDTIKSTFNSAKYKLLFLK